MTEDFVVTTRRGLKIAALASGVQGSPTIVALHGWLDNAHSFVPLMGVLPDFRMVAVDLPGHGASDHKPAGHAYHFIDTIAEAIEILEALGGSPVILMGHSMGGLLAQILGSRQLAKSLILLAPAAPRGIFVFEPSVLNSFFRMMTEKWGFWRRPLKPTFDEAVYAMLHRVPEAEQRKIYNKLCFESGRAVFETGFWLLDRQKASKVKSSSITVPIFIAAGEEDMITPIKVVKKIAKKYRKLQPTFNIYKNHAHWLLAEPGWEKITEDIFSWMKRLPEEQTA